MKDKLAAQEHELWLARESQRKAKDELQQANQQVLKLTQENAQQRIQLDQRDEHIQDAIAAGVRSKMARMQLLTPASWTN